MSNQEANLLTAKIQTRGGDAARKAVAAMRQEAAAASREINSGNSTLRRHTVAARDAATAMDKLGAIATNRAGSGIRRLRSEAETTTDALRRVSRATDEVRRSEGVLGRGLGAITGAAAAYGLVGAYRGILGSVRSFESSRGVESALRFQVGAGGAARVLQDSRGLADKFGLDFGDVRQSALGLAATGKIDAKGVVQTLEAFNLLAQVSGASTEGAARALVQFVQIAGAGKLQGDELLSIQENGVQLRALLAKAGLADRIGSQTNPITFEEIRKALVDFAGDPKTKQLAAESQDKATASLSRLQNVVSYDLVPALGEVFSPVVKEVADDLSAFAQSIDPAVIQGWTRAILDHKLEVGLAIVGVKVLTTWVGTRLPWSASSAALALNRLAASATAASVAQGAGGVGGGIGRFIGGGAGAAATAAPGIVNNGVKATGYLVGADGIARAVGTGAGAAAGSGGISGLGSAVVGGTAAGGAIAGGITAGATAGLWLATIGTIFAGMEAVTGTLGTDRSIFYRLMGGKKLWEATGDDAKETDLARKNLDDRKRWQKTFNWERLPTLQEYYFYTHDKDAEFLLQRRAARRAEPASPRRASSDQWTAEAEARSAQRRAI